MPVIMKEFSRRHISSLYKIKITIPQFFILNLLHLHQESRMTDIARYLKVSTAAVTGIIERLVRCGYVSRVFDPADRRIIKVKLTSKGEALAKKVEEQRQKMIINIFGKISSHERQDYLRILTRIHDILTKEAKEE